MSARRRHVAAAAAVLVATPVATVLLSLSQSSADSACSNFSVTSAADGLRSTSSAPGLLPVDVVDVEGPAAQAHVDSLGNSIGWSGIPYSETAAGNAGVANVDTNTIPVFAASSYPAQPKASTSTPAGGVDARSEALSSTSDAAVGGPSSDQATVGRSSATATSSCAPDGTIHGSAQSTSEASSFSGDTLRIGSIRSSADAAIAPSGKLSLTSSIAGEGITVVGQQVALTDKGLVVGTSATPLPDSPPGAALQSAGITVRYLAATKDADGKGTVAPALQITVRQGVQGVGTGAPSVTYTFGRAYARAAAAAAGEIAPVSVSSPSGTVGGMPAATGGAPVAAALLPGLGGGPGAGGAPATATYAPSAVPSSGASAPRAATELPGVRIANASATSVYSALVLGAIVLAAACTVFRTVGVGIRWR